jgi:hypothetical protein
MRSKQVAGDALAFSACNGLLAGSCAAEPSTPPMELPFTSSSPTAAASGAGAAGGGVSSSVVPVPPGDLELLMH